jgi:hypothetical protein
MTPGNQFDTSISLWIQTHELHDEYLATYHCATRIHKCECRISDITQVYSDIQFNFRLCALQSDIGRYDIRLSPISLITDIGLSAHLWV